MRPRSTENWSSIRLELLNWFQMNSKTLSSAYKGAVFLLDDKDFPSRVPLIAHSVRDIADRLVYVLDPHLTSSRVQYENEMDKIEKAWPDIRTLKDGESNPEVNCVAEIKFSLAIKIDSLVKAHRKRREGPKNHELLFQYLMKYEPFKADVNRRLVLEFKNMREWFMKHTHLPAIELPEPEESELETQFHRFEGILHSFVGNFFTGKKELDEILQQANK
jgi:hypothetical protein